MGRNRKSKEEHELQGTLGKHPERKKFGSSALISYKDVKEIETPHSLRLARARKAFQDASQSLLAMRILTPLDGPTFEMVFRTYESYLIVMDEYSRFRRTYDSADPEQQNQMKILLKEQKQFHDEWVQLSARFGFTPADRAKLEIPEEEPVDILEEILK